MKAYINKLYQLVLEPENYTEKYAIDLWITFKAVPYPLTSKERMISEGTPCILTKSILINSENLK